MKNLILVLLIINGSLGSEYVPAVKEDLKSYARELNVNLTVKTREIKDTYCQRYDAWGLYKDNPGQSYYYRKCLNRYARDAKNVVNHAILSPFQLNGEMYGGGYSGGCFRRGGLTVSVSAFLPWNYIGSIIGMEHEALGHHLGAGHVEKMCTMHPAAAGYKYTAVCAETKIQVGMCV